LAIIEYRVELIPVPLVGMIFLQFAYDKLHG
jgi:hypothetical protein